MKHPYAVAFKIFRQTFSFYRISIHCVSRPCELSRAFILYYGQLVFTNDLLPGTVFYVLVQQIGANMRNPENMDKGRTGIEDVTCMFGSDDEKVTKIPSQGQSFVEGSGSLLVSEFEPIRDVDYLQVDSCSIKLFFYSIYFSQLR